MKSPPGLIPGSKISILSPAGKIEEKYLFQTVSWLKDQGYKVVTGQHSAGQYFQFSGTDEERRADLQEALDDPGTAAIFCSRGGNGTLRIIDKLDFRKFRKHPKWVAGYSDITVLHNRIHHLGYSSLHGVMSRHFLDENGNATESLLRLMDLLRGEKPCYEFPASPLNRPGRAAGILTGGNLSMLYSLTGTPYDVDTTGKILFIEDIDEYLYHIDRMMVSLRLAGKLTHLAALLVGQFTGVKDNPEPYGLTLEEIILQAAEGFDYPVCFGFPAGHELPNLPLMLGANYQLNTNDATCTLIMS